MGDFLVLNGLSAASALILIYRNQHLIYNVLFCSTKEDQFSVSIQPAVGELLLPVTMSEQDFNREQGKTHSHPSGTKDVILTSVKTLNKMLW